MAAEDVGQWTAEAQDAAVRAFAADFRQRFGERDPFFGPVTGHLLFLRYDASPWLFSPRGERVAPVEATPLGQARVSVSGRDLPSQWYAGLTLGATW